MHRFEFAERAKQPHHVLGYASVQNVNTDRNDRRTVEHGGKPAHSNELASETAARATNARRA